MMKNILIVLTVLAMASVANAVLLISVNGVVDPPETSIELAPSDHAVIDIWGDGQESNQSVYLASSKPTSNMILSGGVILYQGNSVGLRQVEDPGELDYIAMLIGGDPIICSAVYIDLLDIVAPPAVPLPLDGTLVDEIDLHCAELSGDGVLYLLEANGAGIFDTQVIHQIPEPITFALLGLGGLFLRRRK